MGILSRVRAAIAALRADPFDNPANSIGDILANEEPLRGIFARSPSGIPVTREAAVGYPAVYRALAQLSSDAAALPIDVYRRVDSPHSTKPGREVDRRHPASRILRDWFHPTLTAYDGRRALVACAALEGDGFAAIVRRGAVPVELLPIDPAYVSPAREMDDRTGAVRDWYIVEIPGREPFRLFPSEVFHVKGLTFDGRRTVNPLRCSRSTISLGIAARYFGERYFSSAGTSRVVIERPIEAPDMAPEDAERFRQQWAQMHTGLDNAHRTAILQHGMEAKVIGQAHKDAQLLELRQHEIREVSTLLGVPPHMLGDTTRTSYRSVEAENLRYFMMGLSPWLRGVQVEARAKLLTEADRESGVYVEHDTNGIMWADSKGRMTYYRGGLSLGMFTVNECRAWENLDPIEGGDERYIPQNLSLGTPDDDPDRDPGRPSEDEEEPDPDDLEDEEARAVEAAIDAVLNGADIDRKRAAISRLAEWWGRA